MPATCPSTNRLSEIAPSVGGEEPFWSGAGATWRLLAGSFASSGFSFEWHELGPSPALNWSKSFHAAGAEICLNLEGNGWVASPADRIVFTPGTAAFFVTNGKPLKAERSGGERHRFLTVEFSLSFLETRLGPQAGFAHPAIRSCLERRTGPALSQVSRLTRRHHELLANLHRPPVQTPAQRLWYESKALEFASEFFFPEERDIVGGRSARVANERVARVKAILAADLCNPPSLEDLGKKAGCSQFYLSRTFTRETGLTISQWLRQARLEKAAELLKSGQCNVTEAAFEVGYSSLSHFSMAFHEQFGCCPGLYPVRTPSQQARR